MDRAEVGINMRCISLSKRKPIKVNKKVVYYLLYKKVEVESNRTNSLHFIRISFSYTVNSIYCAIIISIKNKKNSYKFLT